MSITLRDVLNGLGASSDGTALELWEFAAQALAEGANRVTAVECEVLGGPSLTHESASVDVSFTVDRAAGDDEDAILDGLAAALEAAAARIRERILR